MIISITNQNGGTGKTTTAINLGSALAALGQKVLLIDLDAQGSLTTSFGINSASESIAEALLGDALVKEIIHEREELSILSSGKALAHVEYELAKTKNKFNHLKNLLLTLNDFDFILIDCPSSLSLLTLNALVASEYIIIPMEMEALALLGLDSMLAAVKKLKIINPNLEVLGVLPTMVDGRKKNTPQEIIEYIKSNYSIRLFKQNIRTSVKAAVAHCYGKSVVSYSPSSTTARDYKEFAKEVLALTESIFKEQFTMH